MDCGLPIYHLAKNNTEGMIENMTDFFAYDGLFGVEKETWMSYLESQENTQAESMVPKMD